MREFVVICGGTKLWFHILSLERLEVGNANAHLAMIRPPRSGSFGPHSLSAADALPVVYTYCVGTERLPIALDEHVKRVARHFGRLLETRSVGRPTYHSWMTWAALGPLILCNGGCAN